MPEVGAPGAGWFSALSPGSVDRGAVITYSDGALVSSGARIVDAIDALASGAPTAPRESWLTDGVPLLRRGEASIVPLASIPDPVSGDLLAGANELWMAVRTTADHMRGRGLELDLDDPADPYAQELRRTGARRATWWGRAEQALVLVVYGAPLPAPISSIAAHVVPLEWLDADAPPKRRTRVVSDLAWTWRDAVAVPQDADSVREGAVLAAEGPSLVAAVEAFAARGTARSGWLAPEIALLAGPGDSAVVPLAWRSGTLDGDALPAQQLDERAHRLREAVGRALTDRCGEPEGAVPRVDAPYWRIGTLCAALVTEPSRGGGPACSSLVLVPVPHDAEASGPAAAIARALAQGGAEWTWADIIAAAQTDATAPGAAAHTTPHRDARPTAGTATPDR